MQALSHVDLTVSAGEIVGLIGQNGAGKTTLMDCISGFHRIDDDLSSGAIIFRGVDVTAWNPSERARSGMGRTFQEARLFPSLTVTETLAVACERGVGSRSMVADATRMPASYLAEDDTMTRVHELTRCSAWSATPPPRRCCRPAPAASSSSAACWPRTRC